MEPCHAFQALPITARFVLVFAFVGGICHELHKLHEGSARPTPA